MSNLEIIAFMFVCVYILHIIHWTFLQIKDDNTTRAYNREVEYSTGVLSNYNEANKELTKANDYIKDLQQEIKQYEKED